LHLIGNMGYPVVTRLGVNQFWIKHWYSDTNAQENMQQDRIFEKLLLLYLNYGLSYPTNIFFHEYYFSKAHRRPGFSNAEQKNKYFRSFFYSNSLLTIEHSYLIRNRAGEYFPMRLWHVKYNSWVILAFNCFRPLKQKQSRNKFLRKRDANGVAASLSKVSCTAALKRFKILYLYTRKNVSLGLHYSF